MNINWPRRFLCLLIDTWAVSLRNLFLNWKLAIATSILSNHQRTHSHWQSSDVKCLGKYHLDSHGKSGNFKHSKILVYFHVILLVLYLYSVLSANLKKRDGGHSEVLNFIQDRHWNHRIQILGMTFLFPQRSACLFSSMWTSTLKEPAFIVSHMLDLSQLQEKMSPAI